LVLHKDVEIEVKSNGKKLGKLLVSKGNVEWLPSGHHVNKFRLGWENFAALIEENGRKVKVKG